MGRRGAMTHDETERLQTRLRVGVEAKGPKDD